MNNKSSNKIKQDKIEIKNEGWFSYIKYEKDSSDIPNYLYKNPSYIDQLKYEEINNNTDKQQNIPSENSFWFTLTQNSLNIFEKKSDMRSSTYDYLLISSILPISTDSLENGPISIVHNYNSTNCFDIIEENQNPSFSESKKHQIVWRICAEQKDLITDLREDLINVKFDYQKHRGEKYITEENEKLDESDPENPNVKDEEGRYWKIIKDYGECSVICGGGYQMQQLQCMKEIDGKEVLANGCVGEAFRKRECNTQPCPSDKELQQKVKEDNNKLNEARKFIKFMPITNKPQRYDRCVIMERDALIVDRKESTDINAERLPHLYEEDKTELKKIPVRMVMNSKSIVVYTSGNYGNPYKSFDLFSTKMMKSELDENQCFVLKDAKGTSAEFCQLDYSKEGTTFIEEWSREIGIFQNHCKLERNVNSAEFELSEKINELKNAYIRKKNMQKKENSIQNEIKKLNIKKEEAEQFAVMALNRQMKIENMLLKEEEDREKEELVKLNEQMIKEKRKTGCLIENMEKKQVAEKLQIVINNSRNQLNDKNKEIKKKLEQMKNKLDLTIKFKKAMHLRKVNEIKTQIQNIRSDTIKNAKNINYIGNADNCFIPTKEQEALVETYCNKAFIDDDYKLADCKNFESFCYACCENEFNEAHLTSRDECYHQKCMNV